jgi:hypothetical protein
MPFFDLFIIKLRKITKIAEMEPYRKKRRMEERKGDGLNLPQFDGHFKKYTIEAEGVSD